MRLVRYAKPILRIKPTVLLPSDTAPLNLFSVFVVFKGERGERGSQGSQGNAGATVSSEVFVYETICAYKRRRVAHRSINSEQGKLCMKKNHVYFCRALQEDLAKLDQQEPRETEYVIISLYHIEKSSA